VDLTGTATGGTAPTLSFSPAKLSFKTPQLVGTASAPLTVIMTNKGTSAVTISGLSGSTGFTATPSGTKPCSGSIAPGAKCTFQVAFTPQATGVTIGTISVANSGAINPLLYDVSGTGVNVVSFSPASLTFLAQTVGTTSAPKTVTLFNNQSVALNIASIVASGDYSAVPGGTNPCGTAVAANSSCTFVVSFSPTKTGTIKGVVTITDDAPTSPQVFPLTGKGQ
jgi:Abnormal spindle-like microcephaly-assoc'd, ASPM-SPD-2-Hydin